MVVDAVCKDKASVSKVYATAVLSLVFQNTSVLELVDTVLTDEIYAATVACSHVLGDLAVNKVEVTVVEIYSAAVS